MSRVRRIAFRSMLVAALAILMSMLFASPGTPAESSPASVVNTAPSLSLFTAQSQALSPALNLGSVGEQLRVGHGDVLRLYWAFFARNPDAVGAEYWIDTYNEGASMDVIAHAFSLSDEFRLTYGETSDDEFVRIVYSNVLGRAPDSEGYDYWREILTDTGATRQDIVRWVSASTEFIGAHPFRDPAVASAVSADPSMAIAIDVVESLAANRSTRFLAPNRTDGLSEAISQVQRRFGPLSFVESTGQCGAVAENRQCPIRISEVGVTLDLQVLVGGGVVRQIAGADHKDADGWALDAVHSAVAGRAVSGSESFSDASLKIVAKNTRRIAPAIGATVDAVVNQVPECNEGVIAGATPDAPGVRRRACSFTVTGPIMAIQVEAVTHNDVFAGLNVRIPPLYAEQDYTPYATIGAVTLHHPANRVERIGYHESGHDGSQQQEPVANDTKMMVMSSRNRGTGSHSAADIAVHPDAELRAPVTGTVLRAGSYTLYCKYSDNFLVIEPDARPGYQVKMLHFEGLSVAKGDRVEAGETVVGARARKFPFDSQVDAFTSDPSSGHIHIEVVDPTIPDRPSGGGC